MINDFVFVAFVSDIDLLLVFFHAVKKMRIYKLQALP